MGRLDGKVAIITGAARGMGETEARLFVAEGARVVLADVLADEGRAVAESLGDAAVFAPLDVTDEAQWHQVLALAVERFGPPDVLVNDAGILRSGPLLATDLATFHEVLDINLVGPFLGMKTVGAAMVEAGRGSIVNVSSTGGLVGMSMIGAYVASKWGLRGLTKTAAIELGPRGVRVNSLHPGGVLTPMTGATIPPMLEPPPPGRPDPDPVLAAGDEASAGQPIPRVGRPIEIARLALFLASDESSYCTGMEFVADGGAVAGQDLSALFGDGAD
jgi:3alpha(or 20beta)-hydroxysteroid dehydrogenase